MCAYVCALVVFFLGYTHTCIPHGVSVFLFPRFNQWAAQESHDKSWEEAQHGAALRGASVLPWNHGDKDHLQVKGVNGYERHGIYIYDYICIHMIYIYIYIYIYVYACVG